MAGVSETPPDPPSRPRPLPALGRLLPDVYYGWVIAVGASLLSFLVVGIGFYGMAVFLDALCSERGWPKASVSFATTLYFVTSGLAGPLIGRSVDRHGARTWIGVGSIVMALALLAIGRVGVPWQLALAYPLLAMGFSMAGGIPSSAIVTRWFVARRARAMSVAQTGVSVGGVVLVPLAVGLIAREGLEATTRLLAGLLVAGVLPLAIFVLRDAPQEHGLAPDGGVVPASGLSPLDSAAQQRTWRTREALRTRAFWILVASFSVILFCQVATAMHQISLLRDHMDGTRAAFAVSTTAFGSIVARLVVGSFADRVSKRRVGMALMLLQACALVTFALASEVAALYGASLVFGFTIGNLFMLQMLLVGEIFGVTSYATVMGLLQLLTQTASGLGPFALGLLYSAFGAYRPGLLILAALAVAAAAILSRVRPVPQAQSKANVR